MANAVSNTFGNICRYGESARGAVQDFIINFNEAQCDIDYILSQTLDLFHQFIETFNGRLLKGRLIAMVKYKHNDNAGEESERFYHFPSYNSEIISDVNEFYVRHMCKLINRMDAFHRNGSNLILVCIKHIHIHLSKVTPNAICM